MRRWFVMLGALLLLGPTGCAALLLPAAIGVGVGAGVEADAFIDHLKKDEKHTSEAHPQ